MNLKDIFDLTRAALKSGDTADVLALELALRDADTEYRKVMAENALFRLQAIMKEWRTP